MTSANHIVYVLLNYNISTINVTQGRVTPYSHRKYTEMFLFMNFSLEKNVIFS
jgi:hypothetical protein